MIIMTKATDTVYLGLRVERQIGLTITVDALARLTGTSVDALIATVDDAEDWEPEEEILAKLINHEDADTESEEIMWDELYPVD
jgi:hypothetical protein